MTPVKYRTIDVEGLDVFYREAGNPEAPKLLLLHGFPSSSHMFRDLIPRLADRFHIVAPDLPGFGRTAMPARDKFGYTFDNLARVMERFTELVGLDRFARLRLRLRRADGLPHRDAAPGKDHRDHLPERQRLRGRPERRLESHPCVLAGAVAGQPGGAPRLPDPRGDALAVYPRRARRDRRLPRRLFARRLLPDAAGSRRDPARPVPRLREQRGAVSGLPGLLPHAPAAASWRSGAGTTRSSCLPARRRSSATSRRPTSASSTPATSRSRRTPSRSPRRSGSSFPSESAGPRVAF